MTRVAVVPSHIINVIATTIFIATAIVATTAGKFPFSLGREAKVLTSQIVQLTDKRLAVVPRNILHWQIISFGITRITAHHCLPQCLCHLCFAYIVTVQSYTVNRHFFTICFTNFLLRSGAHAECATTHFHHLERHTIGIKSLHIWRIISFADCGANIHFCLFGIIVHLFLLGMIVHLVLFGLNFSLLRSPFLFRSHLSGGWFLLLGVAHRHILRPSHQSKRQ